MPQLQRQQPAASDRGAAVSGTGTEYEIWPTTSGGEAAKQRGNEVAVVKTGRQGPGGLGARQYRRSSELPVVATLTLATIALVVALAASPMREDD